MAVITTDHFTGMSNITPNGSAGDDSLAAILQAFVTDITQVRDTLTALGTKLDSDAGVTDTDYNATVVADLGTQANTSA